MSGEHHDPHLHRFGGEESFRRWIKHHASPEKLSDDESARFDRELRLRIQTSDRRSFAVPMVIGSLTVTAACVLLFVLGPLGVLNKQHKSGAKFAKAVQTSVQSHGDEGNLHWSSLLDDDATVEEEDEMLFAMLNDEDRAIDHWLLGHDEPRRHRDGRKYRGHKAEKN